MRHRGVGWLVDGKIKRLTLQTRYETRGVTNKQNESKKKKKNRGQQRGSEWKGANIRHLPSAYVGRERTKKIALHLFPKKNVRFTMRTSWTVGFGNEKVHTLALSRTIPARHCSFMYPVNRKKTTSTGVTRFVGELQSESQRIVTFRTGLWPQNGKKNRNSESFKKRRRGSVTLH